MISVIYIYLRSLAIRTELLNDTDDLATRLGSGTAHLILLIPIIYFGAACGRFALRVAPPLLTGRVRSGALILTFLPLVLLCFADDQVLALFNTYELHFSGARASEWTNQKITEDGDILIDLALDVLRYVPVSRNCKALFGNSEHPSTANSPKTQRGRAVVNRQAAVDSETPTNQQRVCAA